MPTRIQDLILKTLKTDYPTPYGTRVELSDVPIIVDTDGNIHDGKKRVKAAILMGAEVITGLVLPPSQAAAVAKIIRLLERKNG